jgi:hypothetical protein
MTVNPRFLRTAPCAVASFVLALLLYLPPLQASTVALLSFEEVVGTAEFIFEGRVLSVEARQTGPGTIHSFVEFDIVHVIKGDYPASAITLRYLGGRVGNRMMQVGEMQLPEVGETGFYFVESLSENLVHPLVGWAQGHYRLQQWVDGEQRVHTADDQPVYSVPSPERTAPGAADGDQSWHRRGVQVQSLGSAGTALSAASFRESVRELVRAGEQP